MGFAPKGHARLDPQHPSAFAICDQCGFLYNHKDLRWEVQYFGTQIQRTGFLVCPTCWDEPNPQLQPKSLPADPKPILNPRRDRLDPDVSQTVVTVATLPAVGSVPIQSYRFVNDSQVGFNLDTIGTPVVGGGTFEVPVFSDGTTWRIA